MPDPTPVILDHDGAVDDFMTLLLVATLDEVDLRAVVVTEADGFAVPAVSASRSILRLAGRPDVPVGLSAARPVNPFPSEWRMASWMIDALPILQATHDGSPPETHPGEELLARALRDSPRPATVVVTGPLSCLAAVLRDEPALEERIERVLWMGGAIRVPGNVSPFMEHGHDGSAEWNAYWDPFAVEAIWETRLPLTVCPVDVTERAGLAPADLRPGLIAQRGRPLSDLAGQAYALVSHIRDYFLWDVTTASYLAWRELYTVESIRTRAIATGPSEGRIAPADDGRSIDVLTAVDPAALRERLLAQWAREAPAPHSFARQAETFERRGYVFGDEDLLAWIADAVPVGGDERVLDVAGGTGAVGRYVSRGGAGCVVLDLVPEMLAAGARAAVDEDRRDVLFVRGDATDIPFADDQFDVVVTRFALHHIDRPERAVAEMARVCRPGGRVAVIDMLGQGERHDELERLRDPSHVHALGRDELTELIRGAGVAVETELTREHPLQAARWLAQTEPAPEAWEAVERALRAEAEGGPPTSLRASLDGDELTIVQTWVLVAGRAG